MVLSRDERQVGLPIERRRANTDEDRTDSIRIEGEGDDDSAGDRIDSMLSSWSRIRVDTRVEGQQEREQYPSIGRAEYCQASIVVVAAAAGAAAERELLQRCWLTRETAGAVIHESGGTLPVSPKKCWSTRRVLPSLY